MPVYLDHAATTQVRPQVVELLSQLGKDLGNPSSVHSFGQQSKMRLEQARVRIAASLDCHPSEVLFTSGGTESNNLAVIGLFDARNIDRSRSVVFYLATEHHAVLEAVEHLQRVSGSKPMAIAVDRHGQIDLPAFEADLERMADETALVSVILANNESGTVIDIAAVVACCKRFQIPVHTDAVAAVGHLPLSFRDLGVATLAFTGHKIGAPVGVGALIVGRGVKVKPQSFGGSQERGIRPGTQNVAGAEALALATELAVAELPAQAMVWEELRASLIAGVLAVVPEAVIAGEPAGSQPSVRLANITYFIFPGCAGDSLLFLLDSAGVAISNGSACTAGVTSASHVLLAHGFDARQASGCVRVSFGWSTTQSDVDAFLAALPSAHERALAAGFTV